MDLLAFTWNIGLKGELVGRALADLKRRGVPFVAAFQEVPHGIERRYLTAQDPDVTACGFQRRGTDVGLKKARNLLVLASQSLKPKRWEAEGLAGRTAAGLVQLDGGKDVVVLAVHGPDQRNNPEDGVREQLFGAHYRHFVRGLACELRGRAAEFKKPEEDDGMIILGDFNALPFSQEISTTAGLCTPVIAAGYPHCGS